MAADSVDVRMGELVRALKDCEKKYASAVRKQVRRAVAEAGVDITSQVKAASSWSSKIPAATSMRANFTAKSAGVRVVVNRRRAPYAKAYELGNLGAGGVGDTFKNGTGGHVHKRPFFFAAIEKQTPAIERKFAAAIDQAVRDAGFK